MNNLDNTIFLFYYGTIVGYRLDPIVSLLMLSPGWWQNAIRLEFHAHRNLRALKVLLYAPFCFLISLCYNPPKLFLIEVKPVILFVVGHTSL